MSDSAREQATGEAERKRRLALAFGDVLPESTRDDRPESWSDRDADPADDWIRRQVPPHHG
jgi:hypothetical protein